MFKVLKIIKESIIRPSQNEFTWIYVYFFAAHLIFFSNCKLSPNDKLISDKKHRSESAGPYNEMKHSIKKVDGAKKIHRDSDPTLILGNLEPDWTRATTSFKATRYERLKIPVVQSMQSDYLVNWSYPFRHIFQADWHFYDVNKLICHWTCLLVL